MIDSPNMDGEALGQILTFPFEVCVAFGDFFDEGPVGTTLKRLVRRQGFGEIKFQIIKTYLQAALRQWDHLVLPSAPGAVLCSQMSYFRSSSMQSIFAVTHKIKKFKNKRLFWTVKLE